MPFLKEHLTGQHYSWGNTVNTSALTGQPSRRLFDRFNGDQVLFIINFFETIVERFTIEEGRKMEELISNYLPLDIKSELSVFNWLKEATLKRSPALV